ncbi:MAG TPA: hypothetical protein VHW04_06665 [Solirubrobacteraceae bacterium]|nr:hypothetical protein [Solirubrobacteraceae bacterium]
MSDLADVPDWPLPAGGVVAPVGGVLALPAADGGVGDPGAGGAAGGPVIGVVALGPKHGAYVEPSRLTEYNAPMIPAASSAAQNDVPPLYSALSTGLPALR